MAHRETNNAVASVLRQSAQTSYPVIDKGIASMKSYTPKHARIDTAESPAELSRADSPRRAVRGALVLALVLGGGVGAEAAAMSGHGTGDHSGALHPAANNRPAASAYLASSVGAKPGNFMW